MAKPLDNAKPSGPMFIEIASPQPAASPLNDGHYAAIRQAVAARRGVKRATLVALMSAVTTLAIGLLALPITLFVLPSGSGLFVVTGICIVGFVEYLGYARLRRADPGAARWLATNQLALLGIIVAYCAIQMLTFSPEAFRAAALSPEFRSQLDQMPEIARGIDADIQRLAPWAVYGFYAFYSLMALLSIGFQGGMAYYYYTRRKHIESFNRLTAEWIRRLFIEIGI